MSGSVRSLISAHSTAGVVVCLTLFLMIPFVSTGLAQWRSFDRPTEDFRALAVADSIVYALTSPYGLHVSHNRGESWNLVECRVPATLEAFYLGIIDGTPVGGTSGGRYVRGWGRDAYVRQAIVDVEDDLQAVISTKRGAVSTWYLGGFGGGVRRSTNKGSTWTLCNEGLTDLNITSLVTIAAADDTSQVLFAGTYGGGVFRSDDDGLHWTISGPGLADGHVYALIAHGDTLYAAHSGGQVSRSSNTGLTWSPLGTGLPFTDVLSLAQIASGEERYVYAGTIDRGVWRYSSAIGTWEPMNTGLTNTRINAVVAVNDVLILGTDRSLHRSTDLGLTWRSADSGAIPLVNAVCAISVPPGTPSTRIFAVSDPHYSSIEAYHGVATFTSRVTWSDDLGSTWTTVPFYPTYLSTSLHFTSFATQHGDDILLFTAGSHEYDFLRCVLSTDRGATWSNDGWVPYMFFCFLSGVAIRDVSAEGRFEIFLTTGGGPNPGMAFSLDSGKTWAPQGLPNSGKITAPLLSQGPLIYATSGSLPIRTSNGGLTWDTISYKKSIPGLVSTGAPVLAPRMSLVYANDQLLFARVTSIGVPEEPDGLHASRDHGESWVYAGLPGGAVRSIVGTDSIVFASRGGQVFASRVDTLVWKEVFTGLPGDTVEVISASSGHLIALTKNSDRIWYRPMTEIKEELNAVDPTATPGTSSGLPATVTLLQNYPNPFNPMTTIAYQLPVSAIVRLAVFDVLGRQVAVLVNERTDAGKHQVAFDATGLSSGVYFYRLHITPSARASGVNTEGVSDEVVQTKALMLLR